MSLKLTLLVFILLIFSLASIFSCSSDIEQSLDQDFNIQGRGVSVIPVRPDSNSAPLAEWFVVVVYFNDADVKPDCVAKVEFEPGDGAEWIDVTQLWRDKWSGALPSPEASNCYEYVYPAPGQYSYKARVTYTDGDVRTVDISPAAIILPHV